MLPIDDENPSIVEIPISAYSAVIVSGFVLKSRCRSFGIRRAGQTHVSALLSEGSSRSRVRCGQCVAVCPTGALTGKFEAEAVWNALGDPSR